MGKGALFGKQQLDMCSTLPNGSSLIHFISSSGDSDSLPSTNILQTANERYTAEALITRRVKKSMILGSKMCNLSDDSNSLPSTDILKTANARYTAEALMTRRVKKSMFLGSKICNHLDNMEVPFALAALRTPAFYHTASLPISQCNSINPSVNPLATVPRLNYRPEKQTKTIIRSYSTSPLQLCH
ncbi:hypothetical protein T265_10707 [Opisthorchis viverrini]|uniref:Uncharacterized protein n=1 Tax=Opisthorchis viverrini TaxID=6198 RepID=A0A074Z1I1_OPIVI|nr:hypothetical protein T265_10707 [Opisthorchis viverrini]KER20833.1 hypothetical protein T265_10707 [Opisthorchis viverrini]